MKVRLLLVAVWVLCSAAVFGQSDSPMIGFAVPESVCGRIVEANAATGTITSLKAGDRVYLLTIHLDPTTQRITKKVLVPDVFVLAVSKSLSGGWITFGVRPQDTGPVLAAEKAHTLCFELAGNSSPPSQPGDFWQPGEFQRLMEDSKCGSDDQGSD